MNKLIAVLFLLGALGAFGLAQRDSFESRHLTRTGAAAGEVRTVRITQFDRAGYIVLGIVCMAGCLYFVGRIRRLPVSPVTRNRPGPVLRCSSRIGDSQPGGVQNFVRNKLRAFPIVSRPIP